MNPIGAALLACVAAGCAWSAWVSLRGRWRIVVITLSAALAVLVPVAQLGGSTATTEHASPPPSRPVGGHEQSRAPTVEAPTPLLVAESAVAMPVPPVLFELALGPVAAEALPLHSDGEAQLADEEATPIPSEVQPPPEQNRDAVRHARDKVGLPPAVEAPAALLTAQAVVASSAPSGQQVHKQAPPRQEHKRAPRGQEHPKKAKPAPGGQSRRH
jgi:hypothetical protein